MTLKNTIFTICALLLGLSACMKDDAIGLQDGEVAFRAVYSDHQDTKTVLQDMTPHWTPADKISVYDGNNNIFVNKGTSVSASTTFAGKLEGKGRNYYLAAYPYNPDLSFSFLGKSIYGLVMPSEQTAVEDTYDPEAAVAFAYTETFELEFKNACSLIKFRIISDGVESVTFKPNADENMSGRFNVTYGNTPRVTVTSGEKTVTLKGDFKKDGVYYAVTLPVTLTEGMSVTLNGSVKTFDATYQIDLARSGMVDLGDLSLNPSESRLPDSSDDETPEDPAPGPTPDPSGNVIYLNAGGTSLWDQAGAWFEVWSWPAGGEGKWYTMTSAGTGIYKVTVPKENPNIIFVRRGPDMTQGWDADVHYWNKTDDLTIPSGSNCYTITGWGGSDGTWSKR